MYSILYVDDDPHLLEVARYFLEDTGEFSLATSLLATEALRRPDFSTFDAIISDYEMPRMDGIAFLKSVRESRGDVPFILFTGKGREEVVIEAINNGADFYLQKGGDPTSQFAELAHKIKKALERKMADLALQESERRYRNLYQYALVGLFETRLVDAKVIACNQRYCDLAGFSTIEEAMGSDILQLYDNPDDRKEVSRILHEQGYISDYIVKFRNRKTGSLFWGQFSARLNYEKDVAEGTIIDITEQKCLEADLQQKHGELVASFEKLRVSEHSLRISEERLVMAQDVGHTGSWEYDIQSNRIWGSAEGLRMFGYPAVAAYFSIADIEACIPEQKRVHQALVDLLTHGKEYNLKYRIHPADGSESRVVHSVARLEKDDEGHPVRVIGVIHDITETLLAEEEIQFKNIILSTQQEISLDAILIVDDEGHILNYNRKFIQTWGIPDELMASRLDEPILHYVTGQLLDPETFHSRVRYLYDHKDEKSFEELVLKDGRILERFSAPMWGETGKYYGRVWYFRDITERKQAEDLIHRQLRFTQELIDTIPSPVFFKDNQLLYQGCNAAFEQFIGLSKEQIIGKTLYDLAPKWLADEYDAHDRALFEKPGSQIYDSQVRFADGTLHDVIFNKATFADEHEGTVTLVGVILDITERKRAEDALRQSEQRFRQIFNTLPIGLWIADRKGNLLMGNRAGQKIWGADPKVGPEEYGVFKAWRMPLREPVEPGDWALAYAVNEGRITEEELLEIEAFDGSHKYILNWAVPLKNEAGEITGAFVLNQDITEMVLWERELRESGEKYRTYIDSSPEGIFIVDGDDNIRDVNPAASSLLGYTRQEFLGLRVGDLLTDATREDDLAVFTRIAEEDVLTHELELKRRDGTTVPVILNAVRLPGDIYLGYCTDISKRKQDEEENWNARQILEGILNSINIRVFWKDRTLKYIGCNTPFAQDAGFEKPEDIIGKDDFSMGWREQADLYRSDDLAVIESGIPRYFIEEPQRTPGGKLITLLTSKVPLRDSDGSIIGVLGTYIDITGKKIG